MKALEIFFKDTLVKYKQPIDLNLVQTEPIINYSFDPNKLYTIMMVDPDAPSCSNPINKYVLHWLKINTNETAVSFTPSNPPEGSGYHRYYIILYEQMNKINLNELKINSRIGFNATDFAKKYGLITVAAIMYITERGPSNQCQAILHR